MPENSLEVRLEATDQRPGHFTLTCNSWQYPLILNPEANVTFSDWLRRLRPVLAGHNDPSGELTQEVLLRNVGTWLWQALLPDSAPAQQRDALAEALRSGRTPLLLALPDKLAGLPWELLCDPKQPTEKGFLARRRPLMRFIPSDTSVATVQPPLRVLLLISSPPSLKEDSRVDVESERAAVEQATREMREAGLLHLLVEDIVTLERVQDDLINFDPHIVHYIGHGGYDEQSGGVLLWEDERGNVSEVSAARLAEVLYPQNLCAVVLHACETGRSNTRTDVHSIAGTLVKEGVPAVLAQQASLTYKSSQQASKTWYRALTAKRGFAQALFEVRRALSLADHPDWAVPILQGNASSLVPILEASAPPGSPDPLLSSQGAAADLPTPTGVFVGRHRELRALRLMLENAPGSGPVLALITGPGGVGKSTLAAQAVTRYGGKYKATLTLSCLGYQSVELFLKRMGEFLKRQGAPGFLEQTLPDPKLSTVAKIEEAIAVLNQTGPFLLVVDNLESVQNEDQTLHDESLLQLLQKLLTNLRGGRVLITGRYTVKDLLPAGKFAAHLLRLDLDDLSPYETNQLLTRHPTLAHLGETVRQTLVAEFGGLPYVYDLLSSDAASQSLDLLLHDVQERITEERKQHTAEKWKEVRQRVVEFVALEATVSCLEQPSQTLLARLGVLQRPFPLAAIEQGLGAARDEWQPLLDWSLLRYDPLERSYRLHSITRHYVKRLLVDGQDCRQTQTLLAAWYKRYAADESHDLADYLEAHRLWRASGEVRQAGELVLQLAELLMRFGLYPLLRELCTTTLVDIGEGDELLVAGTRYTLGGIVKEQGNYEEARQLSQQGLQIYEHLGDQRGRAITLHQLGSIAQDQGKYEEARGLYEQSLQIAERLEDQNGQASSLHHLGMIAARQGKYEEAREVYKQSLQIRERLGEQNGRASSLHQLGNLAYLQGKYEEARGLYEQSLQTFEHLGNQRGRADSLGQLGMIAQEQGKYEEARGLYEQSLQIRERLGEQNGRANSLHQLGMIAYLQGKYEEARGLYEQSLQIRERLGDQRGRANSLHQLGMIAQEQGKYEEARGLYEQSLQTFQRLGDQRGRAGTLHQLGIIAQQQGKYEEAREFYEQSLQIFEQLGDQRGRASSLGQLGNLAYLQGKYEEARGLYEQSLQTFQRLGDQRRRANSLHQLGMIAYLQGKYKEARGLYEQSLQIAERLGDQSGRAASLHQLGMLAYQQGDFEKALKYAIQAFILFNALRSPSGITAQQLIASIRSQMDEVTFTKHWRSLAGNLPLPDPSLENVNQQVVQTLPDTSSENANQQIMQTLVDLIQAPTWDESKRFLESHPELLRPEIDVVLQELTMHQEDDGVREAIEGHRLLLARCRDIGIDAAFVELQGVQSPEETFVTELDRMCNEVVATLRAGNVERQEALVTQLEQMLKEDLPIEGAQDFLQVLVIWLHGQDTQTLVEKLQPVFHSAYAQMVVAVEQEETESTDEDDELAIEDLPSVVSSIILWGTVEQRQQFAIWLIEAQQQLPPEQTSLGWGNFSDA